jgi:redox-sensitive bicupin YhaK (pirin superfamily)
MDIAGKVASSGPAPAFADAGTKRVLGVYGAPGQHWVGDGFPVRSLFSYDRWADRLSPFLLLDYAGPWVFDPAKTPRGVGAHPHRGFETVTIVYEGEVEHRDSTGAGGVIGPGDVQWMTAAGGIVHEEFHSAAYTAKGGPFRMAQLWVNLPAKDKMAPPRYQSIVGADIPVVRLPGAAGHARVIAGAFGGARGPARTFTPINVWDVRLAAERDVTLDLPEGHNSIVVLLSGKIRSGDHHAEAVELLLLDRAGSQIAIHADSDSSLLVLTGEPIDEPVVGYGPFVMNTRREIQQAVEDFNSGRFGRIPA